MRSEYDANNQLALAMEMGKAWTRPAPVRNHKPKGLIARLFNWLF